MLGVTFPDDGGLNVLDVDNEETDTFALVEDKEVRDVVPGFEPIVGVMFFRYLEKRLESGTPLGGLTKVPIADVGETMSPDSWIVPV